MKSSSRIRILVAALAAAAGVPSFLHAQATPARPASNNASDAASNSRPDDETITLSPFEVRGTDESGYAAATSLAGNRLNTELKDVGSAISVVTGQMLRDIAATSNSSLLLYTTNSEVGNIYGNFANAGSGTQLDETGKFSNPNANTRIRGLGSADNTTDYFLSDIPWDSYNVDRIDMLRGPNAILFGLGSPAGIINAGTKTATFQNKGSAEVRYSRFGSLRGTLDVNQVLIPKQLALRVDALYDKEKFEQKPAFQTDKRIYGALRFEPEMFNKGSAKTTIKVNFEKGNVRSNQPRAVTPGDSITPWFMTGTSTAYLANGTPYTVNNLNKVPLDPRGLMYNQVASLLDPTRGQFSQTLANGTLNPNWLPYLGGQFSANYFGGIEAIFNSGSSSANNLFELQPNTPNGLGPTGAIDHSIGGILPSNQSSVTIYRDYSKKINLPGAKFGLTRDIQLSDASIFDFYDQLIDGPNKKEWQNFHRYNATISETLFDGDAGIEAAFDKQHYDNGQLNFMNDKGQQIFIDMTKTEADGTLNPNYGRPFIAGNAAGGGWGGTDRQAVRVTAYAKHDFDHGEHRNFFTHLLGSHTLTGLYSDELRNSFSRSFVQYTSDNAYKDFLTGAGSAPQFIDSNQRRGYPIIYLGQSLAGASTAVGANIPGPTAPAVITGGSVRTFDSTWVATGVNPADPWVNTTFPVGNTLRTSTQSENPANYRGWVNTPVTIINSEDGNRDQNTTGASINKNDISSKALIWQGYFWDGSFVGMYGYRKDTARSWAANATRDTEGRANLDQGVFHLPSAYNLVSDHSNSYSGVLHINNLLKQRLPLNVSLFYSQSENFQPLAGRVGAYGNILTPPTGNTKDRGLLFSTKDSKYSLKINFYKSAVVNSNGTSGFNFFYLPGVVTGYQTARNLFKFETNNGSNPSGFHVGNPTVWTYQPKLGQTPQQAIDEMHTDIASWDALVKSLNPAFLNAWQIDVNQNDITQLHTLTGPTPSGFTLTEDNVSKGTEIELYAQPIEGLRLTINASKQEAMRSNVADPTFNEIVNQINKALNTTPAGDLRGDSGPAATTALQNWNANFWASWLSVKGQENNAVPELRKWRANLIADYDFHHGMLKGFSVGAAYRWQGKVTIGYKPIYYVGNTVAANPFVATSAKFDLNSPYYGPAESNVDLWVGYTHKLSAKVNYRVQLNVRNVGKGNYLIPITVQPDGTVATWRIGAPQVWSLTNTLEF